MKEWYFCYRKSCSWETDSLVVKAENMEIAQKEFRKHCPFQMILACYEVEGK